MKSTLIKRVFTIIIVALCFSCSKDSEDNDEVVVEYDKQSQLHITDVATNYAKFAIEATRYMSLLSVGLREKGQGEFTIIDLLPELHHSSDTNTWMQFGVSPNLKVNTIYEVTILVEGLNGQTPFQIKEFRTPPFDYLHNFNSKQRGSYVWSTTKFYHEAEIALLNGDFDENILNNMEFFLEATTDSSDKYNIDYTYENGKLKFIMPEDILSSENYIEYKDFYLKYSIDNAEMEMSKSGTANENLIFTVFNSKPHFEKLAFVEKKSCKGLPSYELTFVGNFMNVFKSFNDGLYYFEKSTLIITRVDNGDQTILSEDGSQCISFKRHPRSGNNSTSSDLPKLHLSGTLDLNHIETTEGIFKFTTGEYTVKLTFSNENGDFYETEEFTFFLD